MLKPLEGPEKVRQDIAIEAPWKQEYKYVGSIRIQKGVRLFALNTNTWDLTEVIVKKEVMISLNQQPVTAQKANHVEGNIYIKAINLKNAEKKAARIIKEYLRSRVSELAGIVKS